MEQPRHILIVDDEGPSRKIISTLVESLGHKPETARDGFEALAKVRMGFDLILLDVKMPGMDGFEIARRLREDPDSRDVPICMVTGDKGRESRLRAVQAGANDFIAKPVDLTELEVRTAALLKTKEAQDALKHHQAELEATVEQRTATLRQALDDMAEAQRQAYQAHLDTIQRLAMAAEYRDEDAAPHIHRMSCYCALLAESLRWPPGEVEILKHASLLHDVGKIGIPDAILLKPGKLEEEEWEIMKQHTTLGARILRGSPSKFLQAGEVIAWTHHEKWDGTGYPRGLAQEDIPLMGRICAVADVFDALTSVRPYKKAFPNEKAYQILREGRGTHFDPQLVDRFLEHLEEVVAIQEQYRDPYRTRDR